MRAQPEGAAVEDRPRDDAEAWSVRGRTLSLARPLVMGVINATPDSFSDGGRFLDVGSALRHAGDLAAEGAAILDVGGESTRPGAAEVTAREEIARVVPIIEGIREAGLEVSVSVDTRKAEVARAALAAGADIVNDVSALRDPEMAPVVAEHGAGLVLMHMRGTPETMQIDPVYEDVVAEVAAELELALGAAAEAGVPPSRVVLDPGIGFGKTLDHNLALIRGIEALRRVGRPVMLGVSRKAFIGRLLDGAAPDERLWGTIGACVAGLMYGARIFRVHDVRPVHEALLLAHAIRHPGGRV